MVGRSRVVGCESSGGVRIEIRRPAHGFDVSVKRGGELHSDVTTFLAVYFARSDMPCERLTYDAAWV